METNLVEQTDTKENGFVRLSKFAADMERVSMAQESISQSKDCANKIKKSRAIERSEYKKLIAFFHENRSRITITRQGNKCFGLWIVSDTECKLAMCVIHPNDEPNWKFMKSLLAKRLQDPKQYDLITTQNKRLVIREVSLEDCF